MIHVLPNLSISRADIENFSKFSHDENPLHVDENLAKQTFFGQTIAHGILTVLKVLSLATQFSDQAVRKIEAEFRRPVFPELEYAVACEEKDQGLSLTVMDAAGEAMVVNAAFVQEKGSELTGDFSWYEQLAKNSSLSTARYRSAPADRNMESFQEGQTACAFYAPAGTLAGSLSTTLSAAVVDVLALCSYIAGMESPGLRSLFTKLSLTFNPGVDLTDGLAYQVHTKKVDSRFRMLNNELSVCTTSGEPVSHGELRSYIRYCPLQPDPVKLQKMVVQSSESLKGKIALVIGGSRGLGANISMSLALAGCHVYASYFSSDNTVQELETIFADYQLNIEFVKGDAADQRWCESIREQIVREHGRLDIMVLSAATPPNPMHLNSDSDQAFEDYIQKNLKMVRRPLASFLPAIQESKGIIAAVSSSFVSEIPKEFAHYVALKQAVEGLLQSVSKEYPEISFLLPRPPRLQTSWNDTPTGVLGTMPADQVAAGIVNSMAEASDESLRIMTEFPVPEIQDEPEMQNEADYHIVIAANFTADLIIPGLKFWFQELDLNGETIIAPYNQILQELINPNSLLCSNEAGINVVLIRISDWLRELDAQTLHSRESVKAFLQNTAQEFVRAVKTHRGQCKVETMIVFCPAAANQSPGFGDVLEETQQHVIDSLDGLPGLNQVQARDSHRQYKVDEQQIHDSLREKIGHIPYQKPYYHFLSTLIIRNAYRKQLPICKVVVVDCDNTLWSGVVGEVGAEGLSFEKSHIALQEKLNQLSRSGVVVSLCSKNEEFDVWAVFDNREDFGLKRENIVSAMINWQPKSENIKKLASRTNLGLSNFVFIDDNPVECAEVQAACPEVLTIQWPHDPEQASRLLEHIWELDVKEGTEVDQKRTQMYKEELKRQEFMEEKVDFGEFIKSLKLKTDLRDLNDEDLARGSQLTMRTNQFNFTTRRRKEGELKTMMEDERFVMQTVRVSDRFGDYGLVGFYIARLETEELVLDTFLLSCRVLGRGVEHYMLSELGRFARDKKIETVRVEVFPTPRNTPARDFLKSVATDEHYKVQEDGSITAILPSEYMETLEFIPTKSESEEGEQEVQEQQGQGKPAADSVIHSRQQQVQRAAFDLSDTKSLAKLIDGVAAKAQAGTSANLGRDSISHTVYDVFARELNKSVQTLQQVDTLEDLGCDSFKIVEITVLLIEQFPWLPVTLLFEHRSITDIVAHIQQLAASGAEAQETTPLGIFESGLGREEPKDDIAVIGLGLRCAGAGSKEALWEMLSSGQSAIGRVDPDREFFLSQPTEDQMHWAGLVEDLDGFDAEFFGVTPREATLMDPQVRLFLESAWKALEDAGCVGENLEIDTGVFVGAMYNEYAYQANLEANQSKSVFRSWESFSIANRLSHFMGFRGPSFSVDTACSSSGTALHLACGALRNKECRLAIAGGVNCILDPQRLEQLSRLGILSPSGTCRPFGSEADGVLLGEGVGTVVLKSLEEAVKDGNRIYGVIKGTALSSGTGSIGFTAPNPQAQAVAIVRCIRDAGIDPRTVSYIETHGTGTSLGDPIEMRGLTLAYTDRQYWSGQVQGGQSCAIGSIKPNIGHLESGAGVLGLIKVLLQFEKQTLLPSITSATLSEKIPFKDIPFIVQQHLSTWERPVFEIDGQSQEVPRRAGLSSFGVGGANAHIILEEPEDKTEAEDLERQPLPLHVFALSAADQKALAELTAGCAAYLQKNDTLQIQDICYTSTVNRSHFSSRLAVVTTDREHLLQSLEEAAQGGLSPGIFKGESGATGKTAFLFTGQGAQYLRMGYELYSLQPVVQEAMDACCSILDPWLERPLLDIVFADEDSSDAGLIDQTLYTQLGLFSLEYALSQLWMSWGIQPDFVMGHSAGEIVALTVSGMCSLEDGLKLIYSRANLMQSLPAGGKMAAVRLSEQSASHYLMEYEDRLSLASVNGPDQAVLSGEGSAVDTILDRLDQEGIDYKLLQVSHAFHSPLIETMLDEYLQTVQAIGLHSPQIPVISCVDGKPLENLTSDSEYWKRQVRDPVRFMEAMQALNERNVTTFVEMGPHPVLLGMGSLCLPHDDKNWLASLRRGVEDLRTMYESLAKLYVLSAAINWKQVNSPAQAKAVELPTYPFQHGRYWLKTIRQPTDSQKGRPVGEELMYALKWENKPFRLKDEASSPGTWLVFSDENGLGEHVANALEQETQTCIRIYQATDYKKLSEIRYDLNLENPEAMARLWEEVNNSRGPIEGVLFLWGLDADDDGEPTQLEVQASASKTMIPVLHITQAICQRKDTAKPVLWIITQGATAAQGIDQHEETASVQSLLWGFGRGIALEHPDIWGGLIDIAPGLDLLTAAEKIGDHILDPDDEDQMCFTTERRLVPRLKPSVDLSDSSFQCDAKGTYLITGGLGALGQKTASWLVDKGAKHLILTSRRGMTTSEAKELVLSLEDKGAQVTVIATDVSRKRETESLMQDLLTAEKPLKGIIHLAGVDEHKPIHEMQTDDIIQMTIPKVEGAWLLHRLSSEAPLDFFICFSSMASLLGSEGRAHYAAANAFLDNLILKRKKAGLSGLVVNWGPWKKGGMASEQDLQRYSRIGNHGLDPQEALNILERLLTSSRGQVMVADIDWPVFRKYYEARRVRPLVTLWGASQKQAPVAVDDATAPWLEELQRQSPEQRPQTLTEMLVQTIKHLLGKSSAELSLDADFKALGMDSLMAVELSLTLQKNLGLDEAIFVYDYPNISALVEDLLGKIQVALKQKTTLKQNGNNEGILGYEKRLEKSILEFCARAWPNRDKSYLEPRWRWMYLESAARLDVDPKMWNYCEDDTVIGYTGAIPVKVKVEQQELNTAWLVDTMILESYRNKGLGPLIMMQAKEDMSFNLSLGQTKEMRSILLRLGWQQVAPFQTYVYPLRPVRMLKGKLNPVLAGPAGAGLYVRQYAKQIKSQAQKNTLQTRLIERFEPCHDQLWNEVKEAYPCAAVRDASYLNWKYVDQPGQEYVRMEMLDNGKVVAVAVLMLRDPVDHTPYKYRRAFIVDLVVSPKDKTLVFSVLAAIRKQCAVLDADSIVFEVINEKIEYFLQEFGFIKRDPMRYFLIYGEKIEGNGNSKLLYPSNWLVTKGDSDIDRPEGGAK